MSRKSKRRPNSQFAVILSDVHAPFHSRECLELVCSVIKHERPDVVASVGDMLDMMTLMTHEKDAEQRGWTLVKEMAAASDAIAEINDAAGEAKKILVCGNHEDRMDRYIAKNCPELVGAVSYTRLMDGVLDDWEVIPYGEHIRLGKLVITHDVGISGERSIFAAEKDFNGNVLTGHTHIQRWAVVGNGRGDAHVTASGGWLGDPKHANYVSQIKKQRNWSHGFNVAHILPDGDVFVQPVPIVRGRCLVNGKLFEAT